MKNKIIGIAIGAIAIFLIMSACGSASGSVMANSIQTQQQSTFSILEKVSISSDSRCYILVDNDTGIEYAYIEFDDAYGGGNCITPLYTNNVGNGIDLKKYK